MTQLTIDMPTVAVCSAAECAYNTGNACHARAITVGDGVHPGCDTFLAAEPHARNRERHAGVGACKLPSCRHNDDYECTAEQIEVGHLPGHSVSCLRFTPR